MKMEAEIKAGRSPKFNMPIARAPRITVKLSQERKVRSLAKKTLGSTRVGRAMRFPVKGERLVWGGWVGVESWNGQLELAQAGSLCILRNILGEMRIERTNQAQFEEVVDSTS